VEAGFDGSTELGIRLARGIDDVDHRTAKAGLDGLAVEFSFPAAAAGIRRADDEVEMNLGVSGRVAAAVPMALPPPRSLRREDMAGGDAGLGFDEGNGCFDFRIWE
jgi:hypothetical protein